MKLAPTLLLIGFFLVMSRGAISQVPAAPGRQPRHGTAFAFGSRSDVDVDVDG
jgi:hypothetical protein